ncbi:MAG: membrane protein insertion efficiency factor YidD [Limnochordales bacterium]|nr:membrane protein insertion efficiency factor YidD [Limnochordales bacterium]
MRSTVGWARNSIWVRTCWRVGSVLLARLLLLSIQAYRQFISPWKPRSCRFYPTCSEYALQAVQKYGPWRGALLAVRRISRCHPWNAGGYDPVP